MPRVRRPPDGCWLPLWCAVDVAAGFVSRETLRGLAITGAIRGRVQMGEWQIHATDLKRFLTDSVFQHSALNRLRKARNKKQQKGTRNA